MEFCHICGLIVAILATSVSSQQLSSTVLAERQRQLTIDTFTYFSDQLRVTEHMLELQIQRLQERVAELESRPVAGPQASVVPEETRADVGSNGDNGNGGQGWSSSNVLKDLMNKIYCRP